MKTTYKHKRPTPARKMKTGSVLTKDYTLDELQERQEREGFNFGFLRHEIHDTHTGPMRAKRVLAWLRAHGYDRVDAYHALNSRASRHLGDWLMDDGILPEEIERRIASSLWPFPETMYAVFGETREQLEARSANEEREMDVLRQKKGGR